MRPQLAILAASDSFARLWPEIGASAGVAVEVVRSVDELARAGAWCGLVVAAGGAEEEAGALLLEARERVDCPAVVVGAHADHRLAVELLRAGAADYFVMPADAALLADWVRGSAGPQAAAREVHAERALYDFSQLIGHSPQLRRSLALAERVIPRANTTVLITGETGTGKELLAHAIHYNGPRAAHPFVEINCMALPAALLESELFGYEKGAFTDARVAKPGLVEAAHRGTLFLDEIGDLPLGLQGKLLKILEEKRVRRLGGTRELTADVRIIAATHIDLAASVRAGRFRQDLYYRLSVVPINLPALRQRGQDVLLLARHFIARFSAESGIAPPPLTERVERALLAHTWPGNVRELRNAIERAVLLGDGALRAEDLFLDAPPSVDSAELPFPAPVSDILRAAARAMVDRHDGNKSAAAAALRIGRKRLYALLGDGPPLDDGSETPEVTAREAWPC